MTASPKRQHSQHGVDIQESRVVEGGQKVRGGSDGDSKEGAWGGASRHAGLHGQPRIYLEAPMLQRGGHLINAKMLLATETSPWPLKSPYNVFAGRSE